MHACVHASGNHYSRLMSVSMQAFLLCREGWYHSADISLLVLTTLVCMACYCMQLSALQSLV